MPRKARKPQPEPPKQPQRDLANPVTSEPNYTDEESAFIQAVHRYQMVNNRKFPTCCEILAIAKSIGYRKVEDEGDIPIFLRGPRGRESKY